jgi:hypothetical protein
MKKFDLGQALHILANLGVIAGIAFLAFELRQNTVAVRSEASQGLQDQWSLVNAMLLEDDMASIFAQGMANPSSLDETDYGKFSTWWLNALDGFENAYYQARNGVYDASRAEGLWRILRAHLSAPGFREYWEAQGQHIVSTEFRDFVESDVLERPDVLGVWTAR